MSELQKEAEAHDSSLTMVEKVSKLWAYLVVKDKCLEEEKNSLVTLTS